MKLLIAWRRPSIVKHEIVSAQRRHNFSLLVANSGGNLHQSHFDGYFRRRWRLLRLLRKSHEHRHADQNGHEESDVRALLGFLQNAALGLGI